MYESPSTDPHITAKEKEYITTSIGNVQQREKKVIFYRIEFYSKNPFLFINSFQMFHGELYLLQCQFGRNNR